MKTTIYYRRLDSDSYELVFDYSPTAVEFVKTVPARWRSYDPARKRWTVTDTGLGLLRDRAPLRQITLRPLCPTGPSTASHTRVVPWASTLRDALPVRLQDPAYKALTRVLHPDAGGDTLLMQQLNAAFREGR